MKLKVDMHFAARIGSKIIIPTSRDLDHLWSSCRNFNEVKYALHLYKDDKKRVLFGKPIVWPVILLVLSNGIIESDSIFNTNGIIVPDSNGISFVLDSNSAKMGQAWPKWVCRGNFVGIWVMKTSIGFLHLFVIIGFDILYGQGFTIDKGITVEENKKDLQYLDDEAVVQTDKINLKRIIFIFNTNGIIVFDSNGIFIFETDHFWSYNRNFNEVNYACQHSIVDKSRVLFDEPIVWPATQLVPTMDQMLAGPGTK